MYSPKLFNSGAKQKSPTEAQKIQPEESEIQKEYSIARQKLKMSLFIKDMVKKGYSDEEINERLNDWWGPEIVSRSPVVK